MWFNSSNPNCTSDYQNHGAPTWEILKLSLQLYNSEDVYPEIKSLIELIGLQTLSSDSFVSGEYIPVHDHNPAGGFGHEFLPKYILGVYCLLQMTCYVKVILKVLDNFKIS